MATRILKNISANPISLPDFQGMVLQPGEITDGLQFGEDKLKFSVSIAEELLHRNLAVTDGYGEMTGMQGLYLIQGFPSRTTLVGTPLVTSSDRPEGCKVYWTGRADDVVNHIDEQGAPFLFNVDAGQEITLDAEFNEDIWVKEGKIYHTPAELGSYITITIVAPAGFPYPAVYGNGNYDMVQGVPVPNANNTGTIFIQTVETAYMTYINQYPLLSLGRGEISSPEPDFLPKGYKIRMTVHNAHATDILKAAVVLFMYKKH